MESIGEIRKKIKTIQSSEKITNAMKMVAAARLNKVQDHIKKSTSFFQQIEKDLSFLTYHNKSDDNLLDDSLIRKDETGKKNLLLILVTSDRGLCGAFNSNILKKFFLFYDQCLANYSQIFIKTIGNKGFEYLIRKKIPVKSNYKDLLKKFELNSFLTICTAIYEEYLAKSFDFCYIIYCNSNGMIIQQPTVEMLLPAMIPSSNSSSQTLDCWIEPVKGNFINSLLPKYFSAQLLRVLLLSSSAEYISRVAAMEHATKNAKEINISLKRKFNRIRQALITKELMEIISGAEVLL